MKKVLLMLGLFVMFCDISYAAEQFSGIWKNQKNCSFSYGSIGPLTTSDIEIYPNGYVHFHNTYSVPFNGKVDSKGNIFLGSNNIGTLQGKIKNNSFELKFKEYTDQNIFYKMRKCNIKFVKDDSWIKKEQEIKKEETDVAFNSNKQMDLILKLPAQFEKFIKSKPNINEKINKNGTKYLGEFINDKYNGWGIFENKDYIYYGQFKNNNYNGLGLVKYKNNITISINGSATYEWSNDKLFSLVGKPTIFVGEFSGLEKLGGKGILLLNNQLVSGDWWSFIRGPWLTKEYVFELTSLIKEKSILEGLMPEVDKKRIAEAKKKEEEAKQAQDNKLKPISKPEF